MWKSALGIVDKALEAWNGFWRRKERQDDKNSGATEQREKTLGEENDALAADRIRNANPELQSRVLRDHGIEVGPKP